MAVAVADTGEEVVMVLLQILRAFEMGSEAVHCRDS